MIDRILKLQKAERADADRLKLSLPCLHLLCVVYSKPGKSLTYYSNLTGFHGAYMTAYSDMLVRRGYATRERCQKDRRLVVVNMADKGIQKINELYPSAKGEKE